MLGADIFILELRRFGERLIEYFIEAAAQINLARACALNARLFFQIIVEFLLNLLGRSVEFIQDGACNAVFLPVKNKLEDVPAQWPDGPKNPQGIGHPE